jgi:hypothetical protein
LRQKQPNPQPSNGPAFDTAAHGQLGGKMALLDLQRYSRLILAFVVGKSGVAWECSVCHKLFAIPFDEALQRDGFAAPDHVISEFRQHHCGFLLGRKFETIQVRPPRGP